MTCRFPVVAVTLLLAAALSALPAAAQLAGGARMVRFGFGGGMSVPTSDAADALKSGVNGQAYILVDTGVLPPLRFNVGYQRFEFERAVVPTGTADMNILSGVAGLTLGLMQLGPLRPYVTAGLGAFNISTDVDSPAAADDTESQTRFGIDGGGGVTLRLGRLEAFVEGRLQNVYTEAGLIDTRSIRSVPVTFGIMF